MDPPRPESPALNIPARRRSPSEVNNSAEDSDILLVHTPGHDGEQAPRLAPWPSSSFQSPTSSRPILGNRSISSPHVTHNRSGANGSSGSRAQRITSGLMRLTPGLNPGLPHTREPEHQWTLFGQMMENEVQLRSPGSRRVRKKASNIPMDLSVEESSVGNISESITDPFLDRNVQSPTPDESRLLEREGNVSPDDISTDYGSETPDVSIDSDSTSPSQQHPWFSPQRLPSISPLYRNILKCGVAYFIASLFTFSPYLSGFIADLTSYGSGERRPSPSGHMVATVAVYYNPAKTMGGMVEADLFCIVGLLYSAVVCICSMSMFWWLDVKPGWEWLADALVILWIGVSMSAVAWMKVWMAKPSFNTACSMTSIILFIVVVKEGGLQTLMQVTLIVAVGALVSNIVCYFLWPQSATENLQKNMTQTLDSFSTLLQILTNTFLLEEPLQHRHPSHDKLQQAVANHQSSFTSLKKNLAEASSERPFYGGAKGNIRTAYEDAVGSLNRLAQHLNGLRSGTALQYELTKAHSDGKVVLRNRKKDVDDGQGYFPSESSIRHGKGKLSGEESEEKEEANILLKAAADMFGDLVDDLGPPLKALTSSCTTGLKRLREAFLRRQRTSRKDSLQPQEFHELVDGIERALFTFESTSNHAVMRLYRKEISESFSRESMIHSTEENSILLGNESEQVFLVYFFIFTLQEFARELVSLVDAMGRIYSIEQERANRNAWWKRIFLKVSASVRSTIKPSMNGSAREKRKRPGLQRHISAYLVAHKHTNHSAFPKVRPHAPNTIQTPALSDLTLIGRVKQTLWSIGDRLRERDLKYAFKVGMATAILATPAFLDSTRPTFVHYRGEWALISFFVVMSPTIGATNFLSVHRILGTLFGALSATGIYSLFPDNPYVLSLFGFFYSLPCFYYIVAKPEYATSSRFVLLTYNLTCLFCYNFRQKDISVLDVAFHRSVSVTVGVVWAALVSRFWWPSEARRELSKALSEFCLNIGWLYTRLVTANSFAPEEATTDGEYTPPTEGTSLLKPASNRLNSSIHEFMAMELHLQIKLIELQELLAQTQHEPRLKGPFPVALYRSILTSLQTILDRLHSMRCVTTREEWFTTVRQDFIIPVNRERREMVGNVILSFSTLASAFRLKAPLPPYLPPTEKSRQRLVAAIRKLDVVKNRDVKGSRHLLFFAYALSMKGVTQELESLGRTLQDAFGVIGQTPEEFEALFRDQERRVRDTV